MVTASMLDPQQVTSPRSEVLYRAFAYDQQFIFRGEAVKIPGDLLLTLEEGSTLDEINKISVRGSADDLFAEKYSHDIGDLGSTRSHRTRWEILDESRNWVRCEDPR